MVLYRTDEGGCAIYPIPTKRYRAKIQCLISQARYGDTPFPIGKEIDIEQHFVHFCLKRVTQLPQNIKQQILHPRRELWGKTVYGATLTTVNHFLNR